MNARVRYRVTALRCLTLRADLWRATAEKPARSMFGMDQGEAREDVATVLGVYGEDRMLVIHPNRAVGDSTTVTDVLTIVRVE